MKILGRTITSPLVLKVLTHYKSHIAKLELENEDLKRKEARNYVTVSSPHYQSKLALRRVKDVDIEALS